MAAGVFFCAVGAWWIVRPRARALRIPGALALAGVPLAGVALVSSLQVVSHRAAWWGLSFEPDTVGCVVLVAAAVWLASLFSRKTGVAVLAGYLAFSSLAAALGAVVFVVAPDAVSHIAWLVSPRSFALLAAVALVAAAAWYGEPPRAQPLLVGVGVLSALALLLVPYPPGGYAGLAALGVLVVFKIVFAPSAVRPRILAAAALAAILLTSTLFVPAIRPLPGELRPSLALSALVIGALYTDHGGALLIGNGPNTFSQVWDRYRPPEVNATTYWNVTPDAAYVSLLTFAATLGMLGVAAFLLLVLAPTVLLVSRLAQPRPGVSVGGPLWALAAIALGVGSIALVSAVTLPLLLVGAVAVGLSARLLYPADSSLPARRLFTRLVLYAPLCALGVFLVWVGWHQTIAAHSYALGTQSLGAGAVDAAPLLQKAADEWRYSLYEREAARGFLTSAYNAGGNISDEELTGKLALMRTYAERARNSNPYSFDTLLSNSALYVSLVIAGAPDAAAEATSTLSQAAGLSPTRPEPYRLYGEMYYALGNMAQAQTNIAKALVLKPDYQEALALKAKIDAIIGQ